MFISASGKEEIIEHGRCGLFLRNFYPCLMMAPIMAAIKLGLRRIELDSRVRLAFAINIGSCSCQGFKLEPLVSYSNSANWVPDMCVPFQYLRMRNSRPELQLGHFRHHQL